ncbi:MAG TPA: S41 family peptidase [Candidatus Saccharimonadales bacterium]|nr:S41 family peptidase [Candidatus Saccharimonadales bacterium]
MKPRSLRTIVLIFIALLVGYWFGVTKINYAWKNYKPVVSVVSKEPPPGITTVDFSLFWTVWDKISNNYYDKTKIDANKMLYGAISGMVQSLDDPYSVFLPPDQNSSFKQGLAGQFTGIGAELGLKGKQIIVVAPLEGSPAQKAGVRAGDAILKVNDQSTQGWTLSQTVDKIRGPKGSSVKLSILHKDAGAPTDVTITRDVITVKSVDGWVKSAKDIENVKGMDSKTDKIVYIRLSQFGDDTNKDWLALINKLETQIKSDSSVKGLILDLRNNPGGYLNDATFIASEFLKSGVVVMEENGNGDRNTLSVSRQGLLTDIPMIVLINKGSASASEIVAGALRDHDRAKLLGETSFGKGTVQESEDLGGGAGLHVTVAKWLTPNGTWVHGKGLTPDVSVELDTKEPTHDTQLEKAVQLLLQ